MQPLVLTALSSTRRLVFSVREVTVVFTATYFLVSVCCSYTYNGHIIEIVKC